MNEWPVRSPAIRTAKYKVHCKINVPNPTYHRCDISVYREGRSLVTVLRIRVTMFKKNSSTIILL